jgi:hypothetical protein
MDQYPDNPFSYAGQIPSFQYVDPDFRDAEMGFLTDPSCAAPVIDSQILAPDQIAPAHQQYPPAQAKQQFSYPPGGNQPMNGGYPPSSYPPPGYPQAPRWTQPPPQQPPSSTGEYSELFVSIFILFVVVVVIGMIVKIIQLHYLLESLRAHPSLQRAEPSFHYKDGNSYISRPIGANHHDH